MHNNSTISYQSKPVEMIEHVGCLAMSNSRLLTNEHIKDIDFNMLTNTNYGRHVNDDVVKILSRTLNNHHHIDHGTFVDTVNHVKIGQYSIFNFTGNKIYIKDKTELTIPSISVNVRYTALTNALFSNGKESDINLDGYILVIKNITFPNDSNNQADEIYGNLSRMKANGQMVNNYDLTVIYNNLKSEIEKSVALTKSTHSTSSFSIPTNFGICYLIKATDTINRKQINGQLTDSSTSEIATILNNKNDTNIYKYGMYYPQIDLVIATAPSIDLVMTHPFSQVNLNILNFSSHTPTYEEYENSTRIVKTDFNGIVNSVNVIDNTYINNTSYVIYTKIPNVKYYRYSSDLKCIFELISIQSTSDEEYLEIIRNSAVGENNIIDEKFRNKIIHKLSLEEAINKKWIHSSHASAEATKNHKENEVEIVQLSVGAEKLKIDKHALEMKAMILELEKRNKEFSHANSMIEEQHRLEKINADTNLEKLKAQLDEQNHLRKEQLSNMAHSQSLREKNGEGIVTTLKFSAAVLSIGAAGIVAYNKYSK